tara:strand:+ start:1315 stop:1464 length:150 start_codon:yes stop_codon:yes gene_type:complete
MNRFEDTPYRKVTRMDEEAYELLKQQSGEQKLSMAKIISNLIKQTYEEV